MRDRLHYGMVGGGPGAFIGEVHRSAIRMNDEADLVAGCFSYIPEERRQAGYDFGIDQERNYASFEEMAEMEGKRSDKIDWVSIVTPNRFHYPAAKAFLLRGINVVCEKPLCFSVEEGKELKEIARENTCLFGVTYTYTGHVMTREARQLVRDGVIGDIKTVIAEYPQEWLIDALKKAEEGNKPWRADPAYSGRGLAVADLGTHIENWVQYVTGLKIKSLCCNMELIDSGLDKSVEVMVRYNNGASGMYWASQVAVGCENALKVKLFGEKGTIEFDQENSNYLKVTILGKPPMMYSRGCGYTTPEARSSCRLPNGHPEGLIEAFANIYKDFCGAVSDKKQTKLKEESCYGYPTIDMGISGVEFFNKCRDSFEAHSAWVDLEEI